MLHLQRLHDLFALLTRVLAVARRQADHDVLRSAEILDLEVGVAQALHRTAHVVYLHRLLVMHFHYRAARELDRQVEAPYNDEGHRRDKGQQADQVEQQRMPHERDAAMNTKKFHVAMPVVEPRSEEHTSELQSLMRISYAVF